VTPPAPQVKQSKTRERKPSPKPKKKPAAKRLAGLRKPITTSSSSSSGGRQSSVEEEPEFEVVPEESSADEPDDADPYSPRVRQPMPPPKGGVKALKDLLDK
jgi:hypothetical protein